MNIQNILEQYHEPGQLLDALKAIQKEEGYVSEEAMRSTAKAYGMPVSTIYETATFYSMIRLEKPKAHTIEICGSTCCHAQGGNRLLEELNAENRQDLRICRVECLGRCDTSPNALVDGVLITNATKEKLLAAIGKV